MSFELNAYFIIFNILRVFGLVIHCETSEGESEREAEDLIVSQLLLENSLSVASSDPLISPDELLQVNTLEVRIL